MKQDEIIEMARQVGYQHPDAVGQCEDFAYFDVEAFAKLVAAKEREKWKEIVEDQRLRLQALNEIIGGEGSTTTGNILCYSRWEQRLEDAVKEEREACAKVCDDIRHPWGYSSETSDWERGTEHCADAIRARSGDTK